MKIPLIANAYGSNIIIVKDKEIIRENLPFKPYFITDKSNTYLKSSVIRSVRIPDGIEMDMYKYESDDIKMSEDKAKQLKSEGYTLTKLPYI